MIRFRKTSNLARSTLNCAYFLKKEHIFTVITSGGSTKISHSTSHHSIAFIYHIKIQKNIIISLYRELTVKFDITNLL